MTYIPPVLPQFTARQEKILGRNLAAVRRQFGLPPERIVKLGSNENPLGMSPRAAAAVAAAAGEASRYPDPDGDDLRACLAEAHGVPADWIVLGTGSSEFIEWAARAFVGFGGAAVMSDLSFMAYQAAVKASGGRPIVVPARDFGHDLDSMASAVTELVNVIYLTNPNNPTGTFLRGVEIERFLETVPERVVVILDEAYVQFVDPAEQYDAIDLVRRFPNLVVMRTFSKAYGLAGFRVGYAVCGPEIAGIFGQIKAIYNVGTLALLAAKEAFRDRDHLAATIANNLRGRAQLYAGLCEQGVEYLPTSANFILVNVGDAELSNTRLLEQGVIVRTLGNYGLKEWLRVSIGLPEENDRFLEALSASRFAV